MKMIIAIDPGASGGIAIQHPNGDETVDAMPATEADVVGLLREAIEAGRMEGVDDVVAYVEQVGGFIKGSPAPGSAMFNFGRNVGVIHGALLSIRVRIVEVRPQAWQKAIGAGQSATYGKTWKAHLKSVAQQRYPRLKPTLKTADALLILEYGAMREAGR